MKIRVFRYEKSSKKPNYDVFEIKPKKGMTILRALFYIQDTIDDSLAFRYSCRGAVCGSCAMLINKVPRLACRTQLNLLSDENDSFKLKPFRAIEKNKNWNSQEEILIEPLPHLPIQKDLIVDMEKFFSFYRKIQPVIKPSEKPPVKERLMETSAVKELEKYTNCILCGLCYGSCPINSRDQEYYGPAALAKLYRFHIDPRESDDHSRLLLADNKSGWWGCEFHTNCKKVCPKGVPPNLAIGAARQRLKIIENVQKDVIK